MVALPWGLSGCSTPPAPAPSSPHPLQPLRDEAQRLRSLLQPLAAPVAEFLDQVPLLPAAEPQTLYRRPATRSWLAAADWALLPEPQRAEWSPRVFDAASHYSTFYGTPLAYALALQVAASHGLQTLRGQRVFDYGYGALGAVRLMAQAGADVVGLDVDPMLQLLYGADGRRGLGRAASPSGALRLSAANFPDAAALADVGRGVTLCISKNTLKKGYLRPDVGQPMIKPAGSLDLFLPALRGCMARGGCVVIYNLSQWQDPTQYRPANDARSPFTRGEFEAAGFEVLAFDADDGPAARRAGQAFGWGAEPAAGGFGDLQRNLFALCTVARAV